MNDKQKVRLADLVMEFLQTNSTNEDQSVVAVGIGTLIKPWGLNGFKRAETGNVVYERAGRYFIMLESLDGKVNLEVPFNKETLTSNIQFYGS